MSHTNNCRYCKYKFCFKFKYRKWSQIAKVLYDRAVKRFEQVETITFMWKSKPWTMISACDDYKPHGQDDGTLYIELVAPLTEAQAKEAGNNSDVIASYGHDWPEKLYPPDRDMKILKDISALDSKKDIDIEINDLSGDGKLHFCGVKEVKGCRNAQIILEEAYSYER